MRCLLLCFILVCLGCSQNQNRDLTYIGGRIVNPNSNYVILEHNESIIDTILLDADNNFGYEFSQNSEAVYRFRHYPESQNIYLKPGDSSVLRVNTLEFDESLSFGGDSSVENNFLIDIFLLNEQDNDLILSYYKISPERFIIETDSIYEFRTTNFNKLNSESKFSPYFQKIARSSIDYEHYDVRERYAFLMKKYVPNKYEEFPDDYFDYRQEVDFNNADLVSNFSYMRFLDNYLRNRSIEICATENRDCFDLNNHQNLKRRLNLVHELFENENLKSNFFNRFIRREIVFSQTEPQLRETLDIIKMFDLSKVDENELHQLTKIQSRYLLGQDLSELSLRTPGSDTVELKEVSKNSPSILHTWSALSFEGKSNNMKKIAELRKKFPELTILSINLDYQSPNLWQNALKRYSYPAQTEFQLVSDVPDNTYGFFKNYLNRVYITDRNNILTSNSLSLFDPQLENHILQALNQ